MTQINYAEYDFDDLVTFLQDRLKDYDSWSDTYQSATGQMWINTMAAIANLVLYYIERRAQESFIETAQNRSSLVSMVALLGYQPKRVSSATGNLTFTLAAEKTKIVFIPKYTECQTSDGVKYITNEAAAIEKGQTSISVSSIQGILLSTNITSDGSASQEHTINDALVENSASTTNPTFRVTVDGVQWTLVTSFFESTGTDTHYRVNNKIDGTVSVVFGDDQNGKSPVGGATIVIQYIRSVGSDGNVTLADKITTLNDTIYDEDGTAISDITVTNSGSFLGGDAAEDIEEIRFEAPRVFKTGDRAVSKTDFTAILEGFAGVANANVWGENEEAELAGVAAVASMLNKVKMAVLLQDWELPDATFKQTLSDFIYDISMLTVKYEFVTPIILDVIPTMQVKVNAGHSLSQTQADIDTEVDKLLTLGTTTRLGTRIKHSDFVNSIHDLEAVNHVNLTLEIKKDLSSTYNSLFDWGITLDALPVKKETVRLFVGESFVVTDVDNEDGTGSFTSSGTYTISGTVNYTTGVLNVDISGAPTSVHVRYQQDDGNLGDGNIAPLFYQICKLDDSGVDVTSISIEEE